MEIQTQDNGVQKNSETKPANGIIPRKFLFVSWESLSGDLAWQIKKEGNEVKIFIDSAEDNDVYDGFLDKVDDWKVWKDWADVIVFDDVGFGKIADALRLEGKLVVGGSVYADKLETDKEFGQEEMKAVGVSVLPHWNFYDFDEAVKFILENPGRYVFKPCGEDFASDQKDILFIGQEEDGKDLIEILEHNKKSWSKKIRKFQLQKFAAGIEVEVGAYFNGDDFIYPIEVTFEHKRLFPGDIGPMTGEMGSLTFWSNHNSLFNATLLKMKEKLAASKYVGDIAINCIVNSKGIYPLEFTCRFGYPTISIHMEGILSNWGDFLHALAKGENFELKVKKGFQVGVVVAVPPFPFEDKKAFGIYKDSSILFKKPNLEGVHLGDVKLVDGDWHLAGHSGYAVVITGSNTTVEGARKMVYRRIKNIMLQGMFYRTDIGLKWYHESDKLQTWGYLY